MQQDALLNRTRALPNGAATVVLNPPIDLGPLTRLGIRTGPGEWSLQAPALNTTQLPDAKTMTYDIITSDNADLSSPLVYLPGVIVQTGAGGAGAAAVGDFRFRMPSNAKRYLGFRITGSASGDATGATATLLTYVFN